MKLLAFCLAAVLLPLPSLAQRNAAAERACYATQSQADARECLRGRAEQARQSLLVAERALSMALQRWDVGAAEKARVQAAGAASAREFAQLRAAQCGFQSALAAGGNAAGDRRLLCEIELDERRIRDLKETAASLR